MWKEGGVMCRVIYDFLLKLQQAVHWLHYKHVISEHSAYRKSSRSDFLDTYYSVALMIVPITASLSLYPGPENLPMNRVVFSLFSQIMNTNGWSTTNSRGGGLSETHSATITEIIIIIIVAVVVVVIPHLFTYSRPKGHLWSKHRKGRKQRTHSHKD
jgi:hypothetical protein